MLRRLLLRHARLRRRRYSSSSSSTAVVPLSTLTFTVFGANTGVGKTLVSAGLSAALLSSPTISAVDYLKPLQTGYPEDSDARFVFTRVPALLRASPGATRLVASCHTLFPSPAVGAEPAHHEREETVVRCVGEGTEETKVLACKTVYAWREPVSPHLAAEREGMMVRDDAVQRPVEQWLMEGLVEKGEVWKVLETAGGVASPGPSGTLQCDVYRPFRLPAILVGDGRLGGISSTISAYETLLLRGYDVSAVILEDCALSNDKFLLSYFGKRMCVLVLPKIPKDPSDDLTDWFSESSSVFGLLKDALQSFHSKRLQRLSSMQKKSKELLWWPFTQHDLVPVDSVTVIDSRCGENFSAYKIKDNMKMLVPQFDACASWWTQGPDSNLQAIYVA